MGGSGMQMGGAGSGNMSDPCYSQPSDAACADFQRSDAGEACLASHACCMAGMRGGRSRCNGKRNGDEELQQQPWPERACGYVANQTLMPTKPGDPFPAPLPVSPQNGRMPFCRTVQRHVHSTLVLHASCLMSHCPRSPS